MSEQNARRKFQPKICHHNSEKFSNLPKSILAVSSYRSLDELEKLSKDKKISIFYVLDDSSSGNELIPLRDSRRGKFCTILVKR